MTKKVQYIQLRKKVQLLAKQGVNNTQIAKRLNVSRDFVIKWKRKKNISVDKRGWQKGKKRKYTDKQEQLVIQKRLELEQKFFLEQRRYYKILMVRKYLKNLWSELYSLTISLNLTVKNKRVAQATYSTRRNGYLNLEHSFKLTSSVLVISREVVNHIISSVVSMFNHSNFTSSFESKPKPVQRY